MLEPVTLWFFGNAPGRYRHFAHNVWEYRGKSRVTDRLVHVVAMKHEAFSEGLDIEWMVMIITNKVQSGTTGN